MRSKFYHFGTQSLNLLILYHARFDYTYLQWNLISKNQSRKHICKYARIPLKNDNIVIMSKDTDEGLLLFLLFFFLFNTLAQITLYIQIYDYSWVFTNKKHIYSNIFHNTKCIDWTFQKILCCNYFIYLYIIVALESFWEILWPSISETAHLMCHLSRSRTSLI